MAQISQIEMKTLKLIKFINGSGKIFHVLEKSSHGVSLTRINSDLTWPRNCKSSAPASTLKVCMFQFELNTKAIFSFLNMVRFVHIEYPHGM